MLMDSMVLPGLAFAKLKTGLTGGRSTCALRALAQFLGQHLSTWRAISGYQTISLRAGVELEVVQIGA